MTQVFFTVYISTAIKFLFLLAPFFAVSMFLAKTNGYPKKEKNDVITRAITASFILFIILYFSGPILFKSMGITLDSFRVGAPTLRKYLEKLE